MYIEFNKQIGRIRALGFQISDKVVILDAWITHSLGRIHWGGFKLRYHIESNDYDDLKTIVFKDVIKHLKSLTQLLSKQS